MAVMGDCGREARRRHAGTSGHRSSPQACGSGCGGAYMARIRAARRRIQRGSCTGDGGHGCDGRLRAVGKAAADPAAAPRPRARHDLRDGHLHNALPSMPGASANKNLTYTYRL
ncbi:Os08g0362816 [Oryza sativa Japonica Group]|uniref:Os08g0362816 protein n=1 Tax=Oryza sativa subsp. japonica TaxID=39947 RepID=A0A0P0XET7_ORYSJ|nr:Os08g0362816 [Oryza sativa Japonica Group]